jgi:phospholipid/cholesterol/gamma-HCH transport system ATP-binding protein
MFTSYHAVVSMTSRSEPVGIAPQTRAAGEPARSASPSAAQSSAREDGPTLAVVFDRVSFAFDEHVVLRDVSFEVPRGSMTILLGASGSGKTVVLKLILGLLRPDSGSIYVNGRRIDNLTERDLLQVRADIGMVFQENALFDSLTVAENVGYRLSEETDMPADQVSRRVEEVLGLLGLSDYVDRLPSELSGGQRRRVAIARALAPGPALILFDDPTTGLDPIIATTVDEGIIKLRDFRQVSCILVTHQIRDAFYVATHEAVRTNGDAQVVSVAEATDAHATFMVLHEGQIMFRGSPAELLASQDAYLREYMYMTLPPW